MSQIVPDRLGSGLICISNLFVEAVDEAPNTRFVENMRIAPAIVKAAIEKAIFDKVPRIG
jgi:hypothetical protein